MASAAAVGPLLSPAQQPAPLKGQGSSVKLELSGKNWADEPFEPHARTPWSILKLMTWLTVAGLVVAAVVGLSVSMVIVQNNREKNAPPRPPPPPRSPPPPPPPGGDSGGGEAGGGAGGGSTSGEGTGPPIEPPPTPPFAPPTGWTALWWDEFSGSTLDDNKWGFDLGTGNWGWGNNESQTYTSSTANVNQASGLLNIVARRDKSAPGGWTSGRINTLGRAAFYPGMQTKDGSTYSTIHVEASVQVPGAGQGLWPAFWLFPVELEYGKWPASGEIDAMECINEMLTCGQGLHFGGPPPNKVQDFKRFPPPNGKPFIGNFHTFAFDWSLSQITFYIDGKAMKTIYANNPGNGQAPESGWWTVSPGAPTSAPFDKPMYIILNLAVGGLWPKYPDASTPSPSTMSVDYVRVWAK